MMATLRPVTCKATTISIIVETLSEILGNKISLKGKEMACFCSLAERKLAEESLSLRYHPGICLM